MKRLRKLALVLLVVSVASFGLGFWVGVDEYLMMESSTNANSLTRELRALRGGEVASLIQFKELELDAEIVKFSNFLEEGDS